ncbi:MAG: HAD hydrolase-like protein [Nanoarchaeota archaeon]|nr:HAD hydrolase-like protein [Nanoarchaeota archaeon]
MKKPILAIDLGGTLISNKPADLAHYVWYDIMSNLLQKPEIKDLAGKENYFEDVIKVMEEFTGLSNDNDENKDVLKRWGRSLFAFLTIGEVRKLGKEILFKDFADYLRELKDRYELALITTQPQDSVLPILSLLGCSDIFDYIYESSFYEKPDKYLVFNRFISENGKPVYYIGNSLNDVEACKKLGIKYIIVNWDKQDLPVEYRKRARGIKVIENVKELRKTLSDSETNPRIKN